MSQSNSESTWRTERVASNPTFIVDTDKKAVARSKYRFSSHFTIACGFDPTVSDFGLAEACDCNCTILIALRLTNKDLTNGSGRPKIFHVPFVALYVIHN
jgi:hypothetical protein